MTEGTLARWLKKEGDAVKAGDVIAEIETDKATMEVEAVDEGVLGKILVADGTEGVKVNEPIAVLVEEGEAVPAAAAPKPAASAAAAAAPPHPRPPQPRPPQPRRRSAAAAAARRRHAPERACAGRAHLRLAAGAPHGQAGRHRPVGAEGQRPERPHRQGRYRGGAAGRRRRSRAAAAAPAAPPAAPAARAKAAPRRSPRRTRWCRNSTMRKVIARRLTEAKQTIPHFYVSMDIELDALLKLRAELNAKSAKDGPGAFKLSVNDLVIKAAALTLRRVPKVNASYTEDSDRAVRRRRHLGRRVDPGRPDHADHPQGRPEGPRRHQQRDEGPRRAAPRPAS